MKRQRILGALSALGLISGSIASTTFMGIPAAFADDWSSSNDRPAWNQRCDRDWDNAYCNPKANSNNDWRGVDADFNRDRDAWNRDSDRGQWQGRDSEYWRDRRQSFSARLSGGTYIPTYLDQSGRRIVLRRDERYPLTLVVSQDVGSSSRRGRAILPRNSRIEGDLVPVRNGYRFEANRVRFPNGRQAQIWAVSDVINSQSDRYSYDRGRYEDNRSIASSIPSIILGRSSSGSISGDVFDRYPNDQRDYRRDVVVINPDRALDLRLTRDFVVEWRNY